MKQLAGLKQRGIARWSLILAASLAVSSGLAKVPDNTDKAMFHTETEATNTAGDLPDLGNSAISPLQEGLPWAYSDPDDYVFGGWNAYGQPIWNNYLADLKYLDAYAVDYQGQRFMQISLGLDAQNPLAEAMPKISIFVDADKNPMTGCILPGWIGSAEYRIDALLLSGSVLDPTKSVQTWLWQLPKTLDEASEFSSINQSLGRGDYPAKLLGTGTFTALTANGLDNVNIQIPIGYFGNKTDVNLSALAYLPILSSANPFLRPDLPNRQGDRAPDVGVFNTASQMVVNSGPESPLFSLEDPQMDNLAPGGIQAGPDLRQVQLQTKGDQFHLRLVFQQDLIQSLWDPNVGFYIMLDTDRSLSTGQIPMGADIPTWGGDVAIGWAAGPDGKHAFYITHDTDFNAQRSVIGGPTEGGHDAINDAQWNIAGNVLDLQFSKTLLDVFTYGDFAPGLPIAPADFKRFSAGDNMRISVEMLVQNSPLLNNFTDWAPARSWAFDTATEQAIPPLSFDVDKVIHLQDVNEPINAAWDIHSIDYQIEPEYLIFRAKVGNWIPYDRGILFEIHLDTDSNPNTGLRVEDGLGAEYSIQVDSSDDYVRAGYHLEFASSLQQPNGDTENSASSHDAWLQVNQPPNLGDEGTITITIPLSEIASADSKVNVLFRSGKYIRFVGQPPTVTYYDYLPNSGAVKLNLGSLSIDTDGDGVPDQSDNCTLVANADQRDTDQDGFGNICDPDFNQNKIVDPADFSSIKLKLGKVSPVHDLNGNGIVDPADVSILKTYLGKAPGPSGLVK